VGLPLLLVLIIGFWAASRFVRPAPPDTLTLSSGGPGGGYQRYAAVYADFLRAYGIKVVELPSGGSIENLSRLRDGNQAVDAAFFQAGTGEQEEGDALESLGAFYPEPLWIYYREAALPAGTLPDRIQQLKGMRVAVGGAGSGTRHLALALLYANGIDAGNATLLDDGGLGLVQKFQQGEVDAAFVVGPIQSATVWMLLFTKGVGLMSLAHADAYSRQMPHLAKVVLPRGAADLGQDVPNRDITLVASMATLLVREDTHPALVDLLMQAAAAAHGGPGIFQRPGEYPRATAVGFPLSKEAERFYKSGKPFLQRYLPFWAATLVDRLVVMLIPFFALLVPIVKFAPTLYGWRVRSRIYRRYGELKFLEAEVEEAPEKHGRTEWLQRLAAIEADINRIPTPLAFSDMFYTLRSHVALVRETILRRTRDATEA
jgi:TRAP transporter TAXI family solute receptor